jgi:hypothetical protein
MRAVTIGATTLSSSTAKAGRSGLRSLACGKRFGVRLGSRAHRLIGSGARMARSIPLGFLAWALTVGALISLFVALA